MSTYLMPIKAAVIFFPFVAILMTLPFAIYHYRKYGYVNRFRTLVIFSLIFYLISAYYLVILPLPKTRDVKSIQSADVEHYNLRPLRFIEDIKKETKVDFSKPKDYVNLLRERAVLQVIFNVFLTFPLGVYLRYYFKESLLKTMVISFCLSMFFELTQLSGLYGIYNAPYRIFDVDDLFLNTLGGTLGYLIAPIFTFFLPSPDRLDDKVDLSQIRVSYTRRLIAFLVDINIFNLIINIFKISKLKFIIGLIYFIIIPYKTNGRTLGLGFTMTKIKGQGEKLKFKEVLTRNGLLIFLVPGLFKFLNNMILLNQGTDFYMVASMASILYIIYTVFIMGHFIYCLSKREDFFYEKMSGTKISVAEERIRRKGMEIRLGRKEDIKNIMDIIRPAQAYFKEEGIPQWQNGYPNEEVIAGDIAKNSFYVLEDNGKILGIMAGLVGEEPTYAEIFEGDWLRDTSNYMTLHRVAVDPREKGKGLGKKLFEAGEKIAREKGLDSLRIDTHRKNKSMVKLIEKYGFEYCGIVYMTDGGERLAYEKVLEY